MVDFRNKLKNTKVDLSTVNQGEAFEKLSNNLDAATNIVGNLKNKFVDTAANITAQAKRMSGELKNLINGELNVEGNAQTIVSNKAKAVAKDWRVSLSVPESIGKHIKEGGLLEPLKRSDSKMVFPYTPTIYVSHQASYNPLQPVHTNYPYYAYENSRVGQMTITGEFFVQNSIEAKYWVAAVHFLRTVTKMSYGENSPNRGQPPPVLFLNGYGDYTFNQVPVIVTNFQFDLKREVDYISTGLGSTQQADDDGGVYSLDKNACAPSESMITVEVVPQYSRNQISQFNLKNFIHGTDVLDGKGFI